MTETVIETIKLIADEGYVLTNGKTYGTAIFLGHADSPDNWQEMTEEEAAALIEANATEGTMEGEE